MKLLMRRYFHSYNAIPNVVVGSQSLSGTGSCLKDFRLNPFIECKDDHCHFHASKASLWLTAVNVAKQHTGQVQQESISRCQVCEKI